MSQDKLVWKDFNIKDEAGGVEKPAVEFFNVNVTNNMLEVRFYWAGKGTTRIPRRSVYGPLVSAISVVSGESIIYIFSLCIIAQEVTKYFAQNCCNKRK